MSEPHIILHCLPFYAKNYQSLWEFDEVLTKTILLDF